MDYSSVGGGAARADGSHDLQIPRRSQAPRRETGRRTAPAVAAIAFAVAGWAVRAEAAVVAPLEIAPHRAAYVFEMLSSDPGGGVAQVTGGMTFEWADACDGWALDQNYLLRISNSDGSETEIGSSNVTWESKDGLRYRFNIKRGRDGKLVEDLRGDARLEAAGAAGTAEFSKPSMETIALPAGTKFPTDFMLSQMRAASRGVRMQRDLVFEGGAVEGPQTVATTILPRRAPQESDVLEPPLGPSDVWPMYVAYFPVDNADGNPETEVSLDVQANGVVPSFTLDYGIFKVRAKLARIAPLPASGC